MNQKPLSPRQREVMRLIIKGCGDKEIADNLKLSEHTVGHYVQMIILRLGARNRAHAVAIFLK